MTSFKDDSLKKNKWYFIIEVGSGKDRKRIKRRGFKRKQDADEAERELKNQLSGGLDLKGSKTLYKVFMADHLRDKKLSVRESTLKTYSALVNNHILPALGELELGEIKPRHIQNLYNDLSESGKLSDENIQKVHSIINESLNKAAGYDMLIKNPANAVKRPKADKKEMLYWTEEESHRFLNSALQENARYYCAFLLALTTGMRQGEILGLRWKDIDLDHRTISVSQTLSHDGKNFQAETKTTAGRRSIGIDVFTVTALRTLRHRTREEKMSNKNIYEDNDLVVCTNIGTRVTPRNLNRSFCIFLEKSKVKRIRFHDLRHTHVVMLLKARENNKRIAERMGWASVKMIDRYAHIMPNMQQDTADLFGGVFFKTGAIIGAAKEVN
ncbi:site-specific integrase [Paenibacillus sp. S150]|uniref:site-specific integrase n=1 Tax=Paenibacillus sp. S150 TaxID=2749826 RepID=UPI001C55B423|nr:site-specific integrase [Paenibacillus sp. S150]MBW4083514.1 site-specific integrase [Paenibacillus sp. S150]